MDAATRRAALKEILELNRRYAQTGGVEGEKLDLSGEDLSFAIMRDTNCANVDCRGSNFSNSDMGGCDFRHTRFEAATFHWEDLTRAKMRSFHQILEDREAQDRVKSRPTKSR